MFQISLGNINNKNDFQVLDASQSTVQFKISKSKQKVFSEKRKALITGAAKTPVVTLAEPQVH